VGSYLFHTHATIWALTLDVLPIQAFILVFLYLATVRFFGAPWWGGLAAVVLFFPYAFVVSGAVEAAFGSLNGSVGYAPVPVLILAYATALRRRDPETARGLAIGAGILIVSLTFRTLDEPLCAAIPAGTHFLWHCLNALMLAWMISVYCAHVLGKRAAGD
jgi:hypothetical protein